MERKVALEEHFAIDETLMDSAGFLGENVWEELSNRLMDILRSERFAALIVCDRSAFRFNRRTCQTSKQYIFFICFLRVFYCVNRSPLLLVASEFQSEHSVETFL